MAAMTMHHRKPLTAADDHRHGTPNGYKNHGCRCDDCRAAWSQYMRRMSLIPCANPECDTLVWGRYRGLDVMCQVCRGKVSRTAEHGTEGRYERGCRCDECRGAAAEGRRKRRQANPEASRAYDREYKRRRRLA